MANDNPKRLPQPTQRQLTAFWAKIDKRGPHECWPWTASRNVGGYGQFSLKPHGNFGSTRIMYQLTNGRDPFPLDVLHHCDNPPCVNPAHLFTGTEKDNAADMMRKGRGYVIKLHERARGEKVTISKLTTENVRDVRRLRKAGMTYVEIIKLLGLECHPTCIRDVIIGKTWKHVD